MPSICIELSSATSSHIVFGKHWSRVRRVLCRQNNWTRLMNGLQSSDGPTNRFNSIKFIVLRFDLIRNTLKKELIVYAHCVRRARVYYIARVRYCNDSNWWKKRKKMYNNKTSGTMHRSYSATNVAVISHCNRFFSNPFSPFF